MQLELYTHMHAVQTCTHTSEHTQQMFPPVISGLRA